MPTSASFLHHSEERKAQSLEAEQPMASPPELPARRGFDGRLLFILLWRP